MDRQGWIAVVFGLLLVGALFVWVGVSSAGGGGSSRNSGAFSSFGSTCVAVIPVEGEITYSAGQSDGVLPFSAGASVTSTDLTEQFKEASRREDVASVFIDINSPGGSAAASKEAFDALRAVDKPTVAFISEVGASGGYYIAAGADDIVANPNALTGSIGAVFGILNYEQLFQKLGVRQEVIKSGALKDIGSGARNLTGEERAVLDSLIQETFQNFKDDVVEARGDRLQMPLFNRVLDARILSARQAKDAGLIDGISNREGALRHAAVLGGMTVPADEDVPTCDFAKTPGLGELLARLGADVGQGFFSRLSSSAPKSGLAYR
jgi:protease-4